MHRINHPIVMSLLGLALGCTGSATTAPVTPSTPPTTLPAPSTAPSAAARTPAPPQKVAEVEGIAEYHLENGLRVLLFPDPSQAKVTVNITYFVGSRHEGYGEAGMAHLLEHMVFKGTPTHPDIWKLLEQHGANFNGSTWVDRTNYYETLPASDENLQFALALEADRMINSRISAEDLASEFSVVRNEFEMGENDPRAVLEERMMSAAYLWHNYGQSTIGNKSDIERVPAPSLRRFYERYYQPDNAMLVVAGRFDPEHALKLVQQYYAPIPRPARTLERTYTVEPVQDGERTVVLRRVGEVAVVGVMYHGVPGAHADFVATDALTHVLSDEPSGRLYKELVKTGLATNVWGYAYSFADPGTIQFFAEVAPGKSAEAVRDKMIEIIEGLGRAGGDQAVSDSEIKRYQSREAKHFDLAMTDSRRIAIQLSEWAAMGDWRLMFVTRDRTETLTAARTREVAKQYFKGENRTVGLFIPTKTPDRAPLPETPDVVALTKDYKGKSAVAEGEVFEATIANVEARTRRTVLKNGMKVALLSKKTRGGAVKMSVTLHYGSERDLAGKTAAAGLIPDMLLRGTQKRGYQELRDELDRLKAEVRFGGGSMFRGGPGQMTATVTTTRDNLAQVVALLAEIVRQPGFSASELEIVRKEELAALEEAQNDPMALAFNRLIRQVRPWPKNDVRYVPTIPEQIADLKGVKLGDIKSIHQTLWGADSAEVTAVGDFDPAELEAALTQGFADWKAKKTFQRIAMPYKPSQSGAEVISTPDKQNALIAVAHTLDLAETDADYPALEMAAYIAAGSASSRLLERLRQKEGLSYGAFGGVFGGAPDRDGLFFAAAICAPQNAEKAMTYLYEELGRLVAEGVTDEELKTAKEGYLLQFKNQLASDAYLAGEINSGLFLGRTMAFYQDMNDRIRALTRADIARVLQKYIKPHELFQVRAGDFSAK